MKGLFGRWGVISGLLLLALGLAVPVKADPRSLGALGALPPVASSDLAALRGADGDTRIRVSSHQQQDAKVFDSTIVAGKVNTGRVVFGDGALGGFSGIYNNIINTGNNNAINGGMNVTIYLQ